jgi:hypothetical protein
MNITYTIYPTNILTGYEDDGEPIYQKDEKGQIQQENVHLFNTEPYLRIEITEKGADPLGRYQERYYLHVKCSISNVWNDYNFIGTLQQAKDICENKLKELAQQQLNQLQKFLQ